MDEANKIVDGFAEFRPDPKKDTDAPPTLEEMKRAMLEREESARRQQAARDGGYGITRLAEMYEEKLRAAQAEIFTLKMENNQLKESRLYVLSLVNFIRSSAYGVKTPDTDPDFSRQLEERLASPKFEAAETFIGNTQRVEQKTFVAQVIEDEITGGPLL